ISPPEEASLRRASALHDWEAFEQPVFFLRSLNPAQRRSLMLSTGRTSLLFSPESGRWPAREGDSFMTKNESELATACPLDAANDERRRAVRYSSEQIASCR